MSKDEPAFPHQAKEVTVGDTVFLQPITSGGLTKREYFAGLAMVNILRGCSTVDPQGKRPLAYEIIAKDCVVMADALIEELEK